jgi:hypothetical protein
MKEGTVQDQSIVPDEPLLPLGGGATGVAGATVGEPGVAVGLGVMAVGRTTGPGGGVGVGVSDTVAVAVSVGMAVAVAVSVGVVVVSVGDGVELGLGVVSSVLVNTHFTTFSLASSLMVAFPAATSPSLLSSSQTMEVRLKPAGWLTS